MKARIPHRPSVIILAFVALVAASLTSCEKEIFSEYPEYGELFFSPDSIDFNGSIRTQLSFSPGQTIYAGITIVKEGAYITRAEEDWTLTGLHGVVCSKQKTVVAPVGQEPVWIFTAPDEPGEYTVSFSEKYSFSAQQPNGTIFGKSARLSARFRVRE